MNRRVFLAVLMCMALVLAGCQLAKEETGPKQPDRLAGVIITDEYLDLFDFEAYLSDNAAEIVKGGETVISGAESAEYSGRIWAEKDVEGRFAFPGIEGIRMLSYSETDPESGEEYHSSDNDEGISMGGTHYISTDEEEAVELSGTVYIVHSPAETRTFYINPVYQAADGRLYAVSDSGMASDAMGGSFSQAIEEKREVTEDGKSFTERMKVNVTFEYIAGPEMVAILEMDAESAVISRREFAAADVPEKIESGAEYIITEVHAADGSVARKISGREDVHLTTFRSLGNGICVEQGTEIIWK